MVQMSLTGDSESFEYLVLRAGSSTSETLQMFSGNIKFISMDTVDSLLWDLQTSWSDSACAASPPENGLSSHLSAAPTVAVIYTQLVEKDTNR